MRIYLVRHGIAVAIGERGVQSDADRMLTPEGIEKTEAVARGLSRLECAPVRIVSSPLRRAHETAEIICRELSRQNGPRTVEVLEDLSTDGRAEAVLRWVRRQNDASLMLVGHLPGIAEVASLLLTGHREADLLFKKAAAACLTLEGQAPHTLATLEWLIQPAALKQLGG